MDLVPFASSAWKCFFVAAGGARTERFLPSSTWSWASGMQAAWKVEEMHSTVSVGKSKTVVKERNHFFVHLIARD